MKTHDFDDENDQYGGDPARIRLLFVIGGNSMDYETFLRYASGYFAQ